MLLNLDQVLAIATVFVTPQHSGEGVWRNTVTSHQVDASFLLPI